MLSVQVIIFLLAAVNSSIGIVEFFPKIPNTVEYGTNDLCKTESKLYKENLKNYTVWAHQMFDSSAKSRIGILLGNSMDLGNYEECLGITGPFPTQHCIITVNIHVPVDNSTQNYLTDYYSSVFVKFQKPYLGRDNRRIGLCFPASCTVLDIENALTEYLTTTKTLLTREGVKYSVATIEEHMCTNKLHPNKFGTLQIIFCTSCVLLVILVLVVTIIDYKVKKENEDFSDCSITKQILFSFSGRRTWKSLFSYRSNNKELAIFHGVKSISQFFIIFAHLGFMISLIYWVEIESIEKLGKFQMINIYGQLTLILDIYFLMSGLLLSYGISKKLKDRKINPIAVILLRYFRLTPVNAFVTFFFVAMLGFSGSGPAWNLITKPTVDLCLKNWWTNILYVNNFTLNVNDWCNRITWYISVDFQLYIIGVFLMFMIKKTQRIGYTVLIILLILSTLPPFLMTYIYNFPMLAIKIKDSEFFANFYYLKPYTYATTYIIGLIGGIMYDRLASKKVTISKKMSHLIFGISVILMVISYGYPILLDNEHENYTLENALYNAIYKQLWTLGMLGTFIVASFGSNTVLSSFLSFPIWMPVSKLSYGLYLVHWGVLLVSFASSSSVVRRITIIDTVNLFISVTTISLVIALALYFVLEIPLAKVANIIVLHKSNVKKEATETIKEKCEIEIKNCRNLKVE